MTYGGATAALFNPFYGLLAYVCFAIIKPETLWFWSVPAGNYANSGATVGTSSDPGNWDYTPTYPFPGRVSGVRYQSYNYAEETGAELHLGQLALPEQNDSRDVGVWRIATCRTA